MRGGGGEGQGREFTINHLLFMDDLKLFAKSYEQLEGVVLPDGKVMKEIEDRGYRYFGIEETDHLKEKKMKELFSKG